MHKCYIQPLDPKEDEPKARHGDARRNKALRLQEEDKEFDSKDLAFKDPPLFMYTDYEATNN